MVAALRQLTRWAKSGQFEQAVWPDNRSVADQVERVISSSFCPFVQVKPGPPCGGRLDRKPISALMVFQL